MLQINHKAYDSYKLIIVIKLSQSAAYTSFPQKGPCYYVGSSQGGRTGEREENDSVIEGYYTDYEVGSLFDDDFVYSQFERERCTQTD